MKQSGDRFLIASLLLLLLLFILRFADATERDLSGVTTSAIKNEPVTDLSGEKKVQAESLPEEEKDRAGEVEKKKKGVETEKKEEAASEKKEGNLEKKSEEGSSNGEAHVEECDPANSCVDEKSKFVACLRVPGKG